MTPLQQYQQKIKQGEISEDPHQQKVIHTLEKIYHELIARQAYRDSHLGKVRRKIKPRPPIQGLYLYGEVGTGKTLLVDLFFECLPIKKIRLHFHRFMQDIHNALIAKQGSKDPLQKIAQDIGEQTLVICFDEFFVSNITDAMLLGELFKFLFARGVCLIATSNVPPDDLYKNGLQRQRFLPAINLIKKYTTIFCMNSHIDYRLRHIDHTGVYYAPLDNHAQHRMEQGFKLFSNNAPISESAISLYDRPIHIVKQADATIWFDFKDLCGRPRSQKDYLAIAEHYQTVLVSNVPRLSAHQRDLVVSFINLIDVFYDAHTRVIISAATPIEFLYQDDYMQFEFERTKSRLIEMQSKDYYQK